MPDGITALKHLNTLGMNDLYLAALLTIILTTDLLEYKAIKQEVKFPAPPFR